MGTGGTVPGDELHDEAPRASGPRHAAPRKPLLTRLHVPTGKAVALAAMPTAMMMAMGLTPQLAVAKPLPQNPFRDGPCVSEADQEAAAEEKAAEEKKEAAERAARARAAEEAEKLAEQRAEARRRAAAEAVEKQRRKEAERQQAAQEPEDSQRATEGEEQASEAEKSEAENDSATWNPLDPLGLGKALRDLLTLGRDTEDEAGQDEATDGRTAADAERKADQEDARRSTDSQDTADTSSPVDAVEQGLRDTTDRVGEGLRDALDNGSEDGTATDGGDEKSDGKDDKATAEASDEEGKKPFPCVEEKKDPGTDERTPVVLPNQPWYLEASFVTLRGLKYHGVVNVTMANGRSKQALKFTADSVDIGDLHQLVDGPQGTTYHVQAGKGTTSTIRGGTVTMYTEELDAKLFGVIPVVFDPEHPPPLDVPFAIFTDVKIRQAGQFGGNLTIPGLHSFITN